MVVVGGEEWKDVVIFDGDDLAVEYISDKLIVRDNSINDDDGKGKIIGSFKNWFYWKLEDYIT